MQRPRSAASLLLAVPLVFVAFVAVFAVRHAMGQRRLHALDAKITPALTRLARERWERPVLRGAAVDGNAWVALVDASAPASRQFPQRGHADFDAALEAGRDLPASWTQRVAPARDALAALRAATQRSWSWNPSPVPAPSAPMPPLGDVARASRGLLTQALASPPAECLAICADVVRVGQDFSAGEGPLGLAMEGLLSRLAVAAARRCATAADAAARAHAAAEFAALHRAWRPLGAFKEVDTLGIARAVVTELDTGLPPAGLQRLAYLWYRPDAIERVAWTVDQLPRWRSAGAMGEDPAALDRLVEEENARLMGNDITQMVAAAFGRIIERGRMGRAWVGAMAAALSGPGASMADPFTTAPIAVTRDASGVTARSVGPDRRAGTTDDVVVTLPAP